MGVDVDFDFSVFRFRLVDFGVDWRPFGVDDVDFEVDLGVDLDDFGVDFVDFAAPRGPKLALESLIM